jgi:hypothetical protein
MHTKALVSSLHEHLRGFHAGDCLDFLQHLQSWLTLHRNVWTRPPQSAWKLDYFADLDLRDYPTELSTLDIPTELSRLSRISVRSTDGVAMRINNIFGQV